MLLSSSAPIYARLRFIETSNKHYKATDWRNMVVYLSDKAVPKEAEKLGIMICESEETKDLYKTIIKAKKVAADYGATGIYFLTDSDNPILMSKRYDKEDKKYAVNQDFKSNMTIVAVRYVFALPNPVDTGISRFEIEIGNDVLFKGDNGDIIKGRVIAINNTTATAILKSREGKKERALSQITKIP